MLLGSLYYMWGVGGPKGNKPRKTLGTPRQFRMSLMYKDI